MSKDYTTIVGLEIHTELKTKSKMFCGCDANWFGKTPNTHTCPVCLGLPGALPVPNNKAIDWTILIGLALNCTIAHSSKFDRKNYFYPDLPKGYQISQYDEPIAVNGFLEWEDDGVLNHIRIRRVHLEEDTGKLMHSVVDGKQVSLVDFNRSGVPLVEIVTEPDIRSSEEAVGFMKHLHAIIRSLGVSDADMEKGSMRIEPNISVLKIPNSKSQNPNKSQISNLKESELPKYKVEVKNINSFRFAKKSIDFEVSRHIELLEKGETPKQETRGWSESAKGTISQRSKEEAADYRYFPEPDIPPMEFTKEYIEEIRKTLPLLPSQIAENLVKEHGIKKEYAKLLAEDASMFGYFEESRSQGMKESIDVNTIASFIINKKVDIEKVTPEQFIKDLKSKQSSKVSDEGELSKWVDQALEDLPQAVSDYKSGKQAAIGSLIGKVMQLSKGKADAKRVGELIRKKLA